MERSRSPSPFRRSPSSLDSSRLRPGPDRGFVRWWTFCAVAEDASREWFRFARGRPLGVGSLVVLHSRWQGQVAGRRLIISLPGSACKSSPARCSRRQRPLLVVDKLPADFRMVHWWCSGFTNWRGSSLRRLCSLSHGSCFVIIPSKKARARDSTVILRNRPTTEVVCTLHLDSVG